MAAILAAILDLQVTCMLGMVFGGFIGLVMVVNLYLDAKIITLSSLLRKLQLFLDIFNLLGGHFGGHLGFPDHEYIFHDF